MRSRWLGIGLFAVCVLGSSCAHYYRGSHLARYDEKAGYRFDALEGDDADDELFVCLAFSGGGTRAAAFAYGVLKKLDAIPISWHGRSVRLLDEVDCISSVSGGSFTAAYYALSGRKTFDELPGRFLYRDVQGELVGATLNPLNWPRLLSPYFSRIDLAAELYDRQVFAGKTYADLSTSKRRPFLMVNATHMESGDRFTFTQEQFDLLGSDLAPFPVARAVAASSAFPILLKPVSVENLADAPGFRVPGAIVHGLDPHTYYEERRRYTWAKNQLAYTDKDRHPYVHLMDGGLADNIGLRAVADEYRRGFIRRRLNDGKIKHLVIIAANAKTAPAEQIDQHERPPGLTNVAYKTATISMDNYSAETLDMMRDLASERAQMQQALQDCQAEIDKRCPRSPRLSPLAGGSLRSHVIEISFDAIPDAQKDERDCFLNLPTSFTLSRQQVDALIEVAGELLDRDPGFQQLLKDLHVDPDQVKSPPRSAKCR
jgi:NTE family protein